MTTNPTRDPIRRIAHDSASDAVPLKLDGRPDFAAWADAVDVVAGDIRATLEAEVQA